MKQLQFGIIIIVIILLIYFAYPVGSNTMTATTISKSPTIITTPTPIVQTPTPIPIPIVQTPTPTPIVQPQPPTSVKQGSLFQTGTTYSDTILELYSGANYTGEVTAFGASENTGSKSIVFCSQTAGSTQNWIYNSIKATPGTIVALTSYNSGNTSYAFMIINQNIPNLKSFLLSSNDLCCGNTGIYLSGWSHWTMDFKISVINSSILDNLKNKKKSACMSMAQGGWGYDTNKATTYCQWDGVINN